ncbi:HNH endonuclease [Mesorhizobium sp.]|uniref:HNH endonuclease n=1 Tax=Mesorhizobium sp. TaxID=1871066 RepID=UPI0025FDC40D|nr:HNH endonuclease [Mesorhizobium sp.]
MHADDRRQLDAALMKAVFDTKPTSIYDDVVSQHYQFPKRYIRAVEQTIGDWIVLRRPRADGGNLAYFATARVIAVEPDSKSPGMSYARLADYFPFDAPVAWFENARYAEEALRNIPQGQVGVFLRGRSVRPLTELDFAALLSAGLRETLNPNNALRLGLDQAVIADAADALHVGPAQERSWRIEKVLTNRIIRDASFRRAVCDAYDDRCAVTRLRIINGGGRSEVQAAHIWPVAHGGPDVVQNGIALSATVHWLFDRHLISLSDDYRLLVSHNKVPSEFRALFAQHGEKIHLPPVRRDWPHPSFLAKHREAFSS